MIPALVSFAISFSLFGLVPQYVLAEHSEIVSPLAEEEVPTSSAGVLATEDTQEIADTSLIPTSSPAVSVTIQPNPSVNATQAPQVTTQSTPKPSATALPSVTPRPTPQVTPTPRPSPSSSPKPSASTVTGAQLDEWFTKYANKESINKDQLRKIAICESNLNPNAVNGIYGGMYQFSGSTWNSTRRAMNADPDPNLRFNAEEAIRTGAFRIATLGDKAWPNCK